jgi:hypothetical protein
VGKRVLTLLVMVAAIALLIAGVAAAAGGLAPSDEVSLSTSSSLPPDAQGGDEVTTETTETTEATEITAPTETTDLTTDTTAELGDTETADEATTNSTVHPDNFGGTISSLRHSGDHTPAAVIKGKKVPGYHKNMTTTTEPTTTAEAPPQG